MFRLLTVCLALTALTVSGAGAAPPHGMRPGPPGPPRPEGPATPPLSFDQARGYAARAATVARQLYPGSLSLRQTPQGPRLSLSLTYMGRAVTSVLLKGDLSFAERPAVPLLPDARHLPVLGTADRQRLNTQVGALATSGLAQATGPQVRVALLVNGAPVADLRFDRASGILLAEPSGPPNGRPPGPDRGPPR